MKTLLLTSVAALLLATGTAHAETCATNQSPYCRCVMREARAIIRRHPVYRGTPEAEVAITKMHAQCARSCNGIQCGRAWGMK